MFPYTTQRLFPPLEYFITFSVVQSRHVATGRVADGILVLGAVLPKSGLCREIGKSVMRLCVLMPCSSLAVFAANAVGCM